MNAARKTLEDAVRNENISADDREHFKQKLAELERIEADRKLEAVKAVVVIKTN